MAKMKDEWLYGEYGLLGAYDEQGIVKSEEIEFGDDVTGKDHEIDPFEEQDEGSSSQYSRTSMQQKRVFSYLGVLEKEASFPLLVGVGLYQEVTVARLKHFYPKIEADLKRVFSNLTFGGTELNDRFIRTFLRLFAKNEYDLLEAQIIQKLGTKPLNTPYLLTRSFGRVCFGAYHSVETVVYYLEEFRKLSLTAKQLKLPDELQDGDVLYNGKVVVDRGFHFKYQFSSTLDLNNPYSAGPRCDQIRWPEFVIGNSRGIKIEKIICKCVDAANGQTMEEWNDILRILRTKFYASHYERIEGKMDTIEGIGGLLQPLLYKKYVDWYRSHMRDVKEYFLSKDRLQQAPLMLSDLSTNMRRKVIRETRDALIRMSACNIDSDGVRDAKREYERCGIKWIGNYYALPDFSGFLGEPILRFLTEASIEDAYSIDWPLYIRDFKSLDDILEPDIIVDSNELVSGESFTFEQISLF
ncbi:hypothetical protein [Brevibacillus centrosporus]|uniref:hypothetical protein n=1 Tax=Brevibacillus centrosporus TaxID=54910 RepID=UPI00398705BE